MTRVVSHLLPIDSEVLLTQMKIRMGLSNLDLAERFDISEGKVTNTLLTWINYLYLTLGSLKIWPDRKGIIDNSPEVFKKKFPNYIVIIDATELKVQVPSALQKDSETFSKYKSHTTFTSLIGVDPKGGILFVSQLYEGSISDKELVKRCGVLKVLERKMAAGEIMEGDAIMADKGFDIADDLNKLEMKLNIPPLLKDKVGFGEDDVIKTQTIAQHRIHVERAICKVRRNRIFHSIVPVTMFGSINQIWMVACLMPNF